jgi:hypothetical protein
MRRHIIAVFPTLLLFTPSSNPCAFTTFVSRLQAATGTPDLRVEAIDITLYQGMAWVREVRRHSLPAGVVEVSFPELPDTYPASADVRAVDDLGSFRLLALDYPNARVPNGPKKGGHATLGNMTITIAVETAEWELGFAGGFVGSGLTDEIIDRFFSRSILHLHR